MNIHLFDKHFTNNISVFVNNSNAFRDFATNMFYMVFPCQVFVNKISKNLVTLTLTISKLSL